MSSDLPERFRRIIAAVQAQDAAVFAEHPEKRAVVRPYVPGELHPAAVPPEVELWVLVVNLSDTVGGRWRVPLERHEVGPVFKWVAQWRMGERLEDVPVPPEVEAHHARRLLGEALGGGDSQ